MNFLYVHIFELSVFWDFPVIILYILYTLVSYNSFCCYNSSQQMDLAFICLYSSAMFSLL